MFEDQDPRHELGEEEEEELEGSEGDDPAWGAHEQSSSLEEGGPWEWGVWYWDQAYGSTPRWGPREPQGCCCCCCCRRRHPLSAPSLFLDAFAGPTCCDGAEVQTWGRETLPGEQPPCQWVQDMKANQPPEQASSSSLRTLSHPSYQSFYSAVALRNLSASSSPEDSVWPSKLQPKAGSLPHVDCSDFFYTDPRMPPGHRIYNWLSSSSQEVFHHLRLNTPAPIMAIHQAPPLPPPPPPPAPKPPRHRRWFSGLECKVACAFLELAGAPHPDTDGGWSPPPMGKAEEQPEKTSAPDRLL